MTTYFSRKLIAIFPILMYTCLAFAQVPDCRDASLQKEAKFAIENGYVASGYSAALASGFIAQLPKLSEDTRNDVEVLKRNLVRAWKLKGPNALRMCSVELAPKSNAYLLIVAARNPDSPYDLGYAAFNIGTPGSGTGASGWLQD